MNFQKYFHEASVSILHQRSMQIWTISCGAVGNKQNLFWKRISISKETYNGKGVYSTSAHLRFFSVSLLIQFNKLLGTASVS